MRIQDMINQTTFITSVGFSEDSMEITFFEDREQGEEVIMARTMVLSINTEERMQLYAEIQERLCDLVEWGYVELRNPPKKISVQDHRAARRQAEEDAADYEG